MASGAAPEVVAALEVALEVAALEVAADAVTVVPFITSASARTV